MCIRDSNRTELLPEADTFTKVECTVEGVTEAYKADNGAGYVITAASKGYGGDVPVMVAFNSEGTITAVKFLDNDETPGLGQNCLLYTSPRQVWWSAWRSEDFFRQKNSCAPCVGLGGMVS